MIMDNQEAFSVSLVASPALCTLQNVCRTLDIWFDQVADQNKLYVSNNKVFKQKNPRIPVSSRSMHQLIEIKRNATMQSAML